MKKLFIAAVILLLPLSVKASEFYIAIDDGREVIYEAYDVVFKDWHYYFKPSPFGTYEINEEYYIHNLAYAQGFYDGDEYFATIQMLIYQNTHPEYDFYLVDKNLKPFDNSWDIDNIINTISYFERIPSFADKTFYLDLFEELSLEETGLSRYIVNGKQIENDQITLRFDETGKYTIDFEAPHLDIVDNYFTVDTYVLKPFSIEIVVDKYYDLTLETYNNGVLVTNNFSINGQSHNDSKIRLSAGTYEITDNYTNKIYTYELLDDSEFIINNYFINKLDTNISIDKICDEDTCYEFTKNNNIYEFASSLDAHSYQIYSSDTTYNLDLTNTDNYEIDNGILTFKYFVDLSDEEQEETVDDEEKDTTNETPQVDESQNEVENENVAIKVPDTNIAYMDNLTYYVEKKYYIFNNIFNSNNLFSSI